MQSFSQQPRDDGPDDEREAAIGWPASLKSALCSGLLVLVLFLLWDRIPEATGGARGAGGGESGAGMNESGNSAGGLGGGDNTGIGQAGDHEGEQGDDTGSGEVADAANTGDGRGEVNAPDDGDGRAQTPGDADAAADAGEVTEAGDKGVPMPTQQDAAGDSQAAGEAGPAATAETSPDSPPNTGAPPEVKPPDAIGSTTPETPPTAAPAAPANQGFVRADLSRLAGSNSKSLPGNAWQGGNMFQMQGNAKTVVYVVDRSGSMGVARGGDVRVEKLGRAKQELLQALRNLNEEQSFFVVFFNDGATTMPGEGLMKATQANVDRVSEWLLGISRGGSTDPGDAMGIALALKPEVIWLLSDGNIDDHEVDDIRNQNSGRIPINTIGFFRDAETLKTVANENNGEYRYVAW